MPGHRGGGRARGGRPPAHQQILQVGRHQCQHDPQQCTSATSHVTTTHHRKSGTTCTPNRLHIPTPKVGAGGRGDFRAALDCILAAYRIGGETMTSRFTELNIDCHHPHELAAFWCAVLGYRIIDEQPGWVEIAGWEPT